MLYLYYWASRIFSARIHCYVNQWQQLRVVALGLLLSPFTGPGQVFGQAKTIELSPVLAKSTLLGSLDQTQQISVVLTLPLSDPLGAAEFVRHVSKPGDPLFHQYLTPQEFAARYGANAADYAALKQWASNNGLTIVHESVARTSLTVRGSTVQLEKLFKTELNNYRSPDGKQFYSAAVKPTVPDEIGSHLSGVIGLTNSAQYASLAKPYKVLGEDAAVPATGPNIGGTGPGGTYSASDLRTCYQIPDFGDVVPQTVAVFEQGGFSQSDVNEYLKTMKLPHPPITFVSVDGYNGAVDNSDVELEAVLDIDMIIGINPKVQQVLVYEDGTDSFGVALIDALDQVATDNKAQTLSISYGLDEVQQGDAQMAAENVALTQLQSEGITVLASAGDDGAYGRTGAFSYPAQLEAPDPGSQPLVTCVGGTTLTTGPNEEYNGEEVWNRLGLNFGATGGGVSSYWAIPDWQAPSYVTNNGGSSSNRNVPDVGAIGDPLTGVAIYSKINGGWVQVGGTSVSAPVWGGYISVLNSGLQYLFGQKIGFFNPTLYSIGFDDPANYLFPVPDGSNGNAALYGGTPGYNAGFGYTNCTGSGTIYGGAFGTQVLIANATGGKAPSGFVIFPLKLSKTSLKLRWTKSDLATGYIIELIRPTSTFNISAAYVTKQTKLTITGLTSEVGYLLYVYAVNAGGSTWEFTDFVTP
jgi:subtilase family serine protease